MTYLTINTDARAWTDDARCLGIEMQPEAATPDEVAQLVDVCAGCPVAELCRELATEQPEAYGVHAGEWWGKAPRSAACRWCGEAIPARVGHQSYCTPEHRAEARQARLASRSSA